MTEGHGHSSLFQGRGDCKCPAGTAIPQVDVRHEALKANEKVQGCKKKLKKLQADAKGDDDIAPGQKTSSTRSSEEDGVWSEEIQSMKMRLNREEERSQVLDEERAGRRLEVEGLPEMSGDPTANAVQPSEVEAALWK